VFLLFSRSIFNVDTILAISSAFLSGDILFFVFPTLINWFFLAERTDYGEVSNYFTLFEDKKSMLLN
jgi:hypothetical protein